jgi:hypothetical protein
MGLLATWVLAACQAPQYGTAADGGDARAGERSEDASSSRSARDLKDGSSVQTMHDDGGAGAGRTGNDRSSSAAIEDGSANEPGGPDTNLPAAGTSNDAGEPLVSTVPKWATPLLGRYAMRGFSFKQDRFGTVTRAEQVAIVEFALEGSGMTLRSKMCVSTGDNTEAQIRLVDTSRLPDRVEQVMFSELERSWSTVGSTYEVGFTHKPPASCDGKAGQSVARAEQQVWLTASTCRCVAEGEKPVADDCRITDPDLDRNPGVTFMLKGLQSALVDSTMYFAIDSDTHFVGGRVGAEGTAPSASMNAVERNYQLGCDPSCFEIGELGTPCPLSFSRVSFAPLQAATTTTCADVAANVNALFPEPVPVLPSACL